MENEKITVQIGTQVLGFQPDPGNEDHKRFADEIKEVAANSPKSIQEFFCKLAELQKRKTKRVVNSNSAKNSKKR